jgi:hypothetical protein
MPGVSFAGGTLRQFRHQGPGFRVPPFPGWGRDAEQRPGGERRKGRPVPRRQDEAPGRTAVTAATALRASPPPGPAAAAKGKGVGDDP